MSYSILKQQNQIMIKFSSTYCLSFEDALKLLERFKRIHGDVSRYWTLESSGSPLNLPLHEVCCLNKHENIEKANECFENMILTLEMSTTETERLICLEEFKEELSGILVEKELIRFLFQLYR